MDTKYSLAINVTINYKREVQVVEYKVVNLLNGAVTIVVAASIFQAIRRAKRYFSEPNRSKIPVQILGSN